MKKNILTVVVLALCLANLVMTALLIFTVLPATKRSDALITQVASVIELELTGYDDVVYKATDLETYRVEEKLTKNLKPGEVIPGEKVVNHYASLDYVSVSINKNSEDYKTYNENLIAKSYDSKIMEIVGMTFNNYTYDEAVREESKIKKDILTEIKKYFGSTDFIVDISLGNFVLS